GSGRPGKAVAPLECSELSTRGGRHETSVDRIALAGPDRRSPAGRPRPGAHQDRGGGPALGAGGLRRPEQPARRRGRRPGDQRGRRPARRPQDRDRGRRLARNDDWGRATSGVYQARLKELGGTVLSAEFYTPGEKDFYSYLTKIKALNPEGINVVDVSAPAATQVKQMAELGIKAAPLGSD